MTINRFDQNHRQTRYYTSTVSYSNNNNMRYTDVGYYDFMYYIYIMVKRCTFSSKTVRRNDTAMNARCTHTSVKQNKKGFRIVYKFSETFNFNNKTKKSRPSRIQWFSTFFLSRPLIFLVFVLRQLRRIFFYSSTYNLTTDKIFTMYKVLINLRLKI